MNSKRSQRAKHDRNTCRSQWLHRRRRVAGIIEAVIVLYTFDEMEPAVLEGGHVILYSQERIANASLIEI